MDDDFGVSGLTRWASALRVRCTQSYHKGVSAMQEHLLEPCEDAFRSGSRYGQPDPEFSGKKSTEVAGEEAQGVTRSAQRCLAQFRAPKKELGREF